MRPPQIQPVTLAIPPGAITVVAPPPALVTKINADHVGLLPRQIMDTLRDMRSDPRFAGEVIAVGKIRGASPAAIVAFLQSRTAKRATPKRAEPAHVVPTEKLPGRGVDPDEQLDAELGLEWTDPNARSAAIIEKWIDERDAEDAARDAAIADEKMAKWRAQGKAPENRRRR